MQRACVEELERALNAALDAEPFDPTAVERARAKLSTAFCVQRERMALEREGLERSAFEMREARHESREKELFSLRMQQLQLPLTATQERLGLAAAAPSTLRTPARAASAERAPTSLDEDDHAKHASSSTNTADHYLLDVQDTQALFAKLAAAHRTELTQRAVGPTTNSTARAGASAKPTVLVDAACAAFDTVLQSLQTRLVHLQALERRLVAASDRGANRRIELNVGGERFVSTVATLCQEPSYLAGLFSGCVDAVSSPGSVSTHLIQFADAFKSGRALTAPSLIARPSGFVLFLIIAERAPRPSI